MAQAPLMCPLCGHALDPNGRVVRGVRFTRGVDARPLHFCEVCFLVFADPAEHPDPEQERARYLLHRNDPENAGYVEFLRLVVDPALKHLPASARILDYGCGPAASGEPVLARLLRAEGRACEVYDPYFFPRIPEGRYDAVFATEVIEHFRRPGEEIARLVDRVAPGGLLAVMTERWTSLDAFASWPYTSDPTHVAFYNERTLAWIATRYGLDLVHSDERRVWIARRRGGRVPDSGG